MTYKKDVLFMNILDKVEISNCKFCPPHYLPHKLPFGKKIDDEPCHYHKARWRMMHHKFFCKLLKCPHYKYMIKRYKKYIKK